MTTTKRIAIAAASAAALFSLPALAADRPSAAADHSAVYGDSTWPAFSPRAPGITLGGPGQSSSSLRSDPSWPEVSVLAPGLRLDTYVAVRPDAGSIDNERPFQALRSFAHLDAQAAQVASVRL